MNIVILGGKTKFGDFFSGWLSGEHKVLSLGRPEIDFRSGWVDKVHDAVNETFVGVSKVDAWIVNVYDHEPGYSDLQENVLCTLWPLLKNHKTTVVVIGSMAHYYLNTTYAAAKKHLHTTCMMFAVQERKCRLAIIEPHVLENSRERYPRSMWMNFSTLADYIEKTIVDRDTSFVQMSLVGNRTPI